MVARDYGREQEGCSCGLRKVSRGILEMKIFCGCDGGHKKKKSMNETKFCRTKYKQINECL